MTVAIRNTLATFTKFFAQLPPQLDGTLGAYHLQGDSKLTNFADATKPLIQVGSPVVFADGVNVADENGYRTGIINAAGADFTWLALVKGVVISSMNGVMFINDVNNGATTVSIGNYLGYRPSTTVALRGVHGSFSTGTAPPTAVFARVADSAVVDPNKYYVVAMTRATVGGATTGTTIVFNAGATPLTTAASIAAPSDTGLEIRLGDYAGTAGTTFLTTSAVTMAYGQIWNRALTLAQLQDVRTYLLSQYPSLTIA